MDGNQRASVTKFFVANIPDGCRPWDLADVMKGYGNLVGVFIARKRNKDGVKFGFVSYKDVKDPKDMETRLQNVKIGKWVLKINVAWYARHNGDIGKGRNGFARSQVNPSFASNGPRVSEVAVKTGWSFSDVVRGDKIKSSTEVDLKIADSFVGISEFFNRALVAKCSSFEVLTSVFSRITEDDGGVSFVQYIGGLSMLLVFNEASEANRFLYLKDKWRQWFSKLEVWSGQSLPFERIAWVGVYGIPLQLANAEIVNLVGGKVGKVVNHSVAKESDVNKAVECVGILVGDGIEVKKVVSLRWREKVFRVWVEEKVLDWCPPCGVVKRSSEDSGPSQSENEDREDGEIIVNNLEVNWAQQSENEVIPQCHDGSDDTPAKAVPAGDNVDVSLNSNGNLEGLHGEANKKASAHGANVSTLEEGQIPNTFLNLNFEEFRHGKSHFPSMRINSNGGPKKRNMLSPKSHARNKKVPNKNIMESAFSTPAVERAVKGGNSSIDWDFNISSNSSRPKKRHRKAISDFLDDLAELKKSDEDNVFMGAPLANSDGDIQKEIASLFEDSSGEHDGEGPNGDHAVAFEHDRDDLVEENFTRLDEQVTTIYNEVTNSEVEQADMNQDPELLSEVRATKEVGNLLQMDMEGFEALIEQAIIRERRSSCPLQHPTGD